MEENNRDQSRHPTWLTEWLEHLQLELIISGFAILLLIQGLEATDELSNYFSLHLSKNNYFSGTLAIFLDLIISAIGVAGVVLLTNLCIHLVLRGLWIGTVGLRSISQTIDYEQLRYSERFKAYLSRKVGSYDEYILRLERICSMVFAFSFIIVFALLGFVFCFTVFGISSKAILELGLFRWLGRIITLLLFVTLLTYFIDGYYAQQDGGYLSASFYDDQQANDFIEVFSIPSRVVDASYLEIFLRYNSEDNPYLSSTCPELIDSSYSVFTNEFFSGMQQGARYAEGSDSIVINAQDRADCIREMYKVYLNDSLIRKLHPKVYIHPRNDERGVLGFIDIATLRRGIHHLTVIKKARPVESDTLAQVTQTIPFWRD